MSFRLRLTGLTAIAVATAIAGASFLVYYVDRGQLIGQVDSELNAMKTFPPAQMLLNASPATQRLVSGGGTVRVTDRVSPNSPLIGKKFVLPRSLTVVQMQVARGSKGKAWAKNLAG